MKTIQMQIDDSIYQKIQIIANEKKTNISNFIENILTQYLSSYVSDKEMKEILDDEELVKNLKIGLEEAKNGDYIIV